MHMAQEVGLLLIGAIIALTSSLVTLYLLYQLQLKRERQDQAWRGRHEVDLRWWERKADAYQALTGDLTGLAAMLQRWLEIAPQFSGQLDFLQEDLLELRRPFLEKYQDYLARISASLRQNSFLIAPQAVSILDGLIHDLEVYDEEFDDEPQDLSTPRPEVIQTTLRIVNDHLYGLKEAARQDLQIDVPSLEPNRREILPSVRKKL
jgi:hypothetical protein